MDTTAAANPNKSTIRAVLTSPMGKSLTTITLNSGTQNLTTLYMACSMYARLAANKIKQKLLSLNNWSKVGMFLSTLGKWYLIVYAGCTCTKAFRHRDFDPFLYQSLMMWNHTLVFTDVRISCIISVLIESEV